MKLIEEDIEITDNGGIWIRVNGKGLEEEQLKQQILDDNKLRVLVEKHHNSCPERWCHCKSIEFCDILEESKSNSPKNFREIKILEDDE